MKKKTLKKNTFNKRSVQQKSVQRILPPRSQLLSKIPRHKKNPVLLRKARSKLWSKMALNGYLLTSKAAKLLVCWVSKKVSLVPLYQPCPSTKTWCLVWSSKKRKQKKKSYIFVWGFFVLKTKGFHKTIVSSEAMCVVPNFAEDTWLLICHS